VSNPYAPPSGPPPQGAPPAPAPTSGAGAGRLGVAALVLGLLAVLLGVTIVGGVVLGGPAVALGAQGRARARQLGGGAGTAVAGIVLGMLGLALAGLTWLYIQDDYADYQGCRRASVSLAQDAECMREFERSVQPG